MILPKLLSKEREGVQCDEAEYTRHKNLAYPTIRLCGGSWHSGTHKANFGEARVRVDNADTQLLVKLIRVVG